MAKPKQNGVRILSLFFHNALHRGFMVLPLTEQAKNCCGWIQLSRFNCNKKNPEAVQKLLTYQLEAADVLHKAFYETEEQKSTFNTRMGLEGRIEGMQVQINNVENMMCEQNATS